MKYARILNGRTVDVVDLSIYTPRPEWGRSDQDLMNRIYEAVGGFSAFIVVPDDTENGAVDNGDGTFSNPLPPGPEPEPEPDEPLEDEGSGDGETP